MSSDKSDVPADAPEACPGTQSESAGKEAACSGCPNQKICASGMPRAPDPDVDVIKGNLMQFLQSGRDGGRERKQERQTDCVTYIVSNCVTYEHYLKVVMTP